MATITTGTNLAGYEIERAIGKGGMGYIWLAKQVSIDRQVALKILSPKMVAQDPKSAERFIAEARAAGRLSHANIIAVHDVGETEHEGIAVHYFSMEYINGDNFREIVDRDGPLEPDAVANVMNAMADALAYAHNLGMIHRDIKPENIMITSDGRVKLADFGLAKEVDNDDDVERDKDGRVKVMGTPLYMSPEQARGKPLDTRSDLYSLGATLFFLLTGTAPFRRKTSRETMRAHVHDPIPDPGDVQPCPKPWRELCMRLMAKDPDDRFGDTSELKAAVADAIRGKSFTPTQGKRRQTADTNTGGSKNLPIFIGGGLAVVVLLAAVVALLPDSGEENPNANNGTTETPGTNSDPSGNSSTSRLAEAQKYLNQLPAGKLKETYKELTGVKGLRNPYFQADPEALALIQRRVDEIKATLDGRKRQRELEFARKLDAIERSLASNDLATARTRYAALDAGVSENLPRRYEEVTTAIDAAFSALHEKALRDIQQANADTVVDLIVTRTQESGLDGERLTAIQTAAAERKEELQHAISSLSREQQARERLIYDDLIRDLRNERRHESNSRPDFDTFIARAERELVRLANNETLKQQIENIIILGKQALATEQALTDYVAKEQPPVNAMLASGPTPCIMNSYDGGVFKLTVNRSRLILKRNIADSDLAVESLVSKAIEQAGLKRSNAHQLAFLWMWDLPAGDDLAVKKSTSEKLRNLLLSIDPDLFELSVEVDASVPANRAQFAGDGLKSLNDALRFQPRSMSPFTMRDFTTRQREVVDALSEDHLDTMRWRTRLLAPATFEAHVRLQENAKTVVGLKQNGHSLRLYADSERNITALAWTGNNNIIRLGHSQDQDERTDDVMILTFSVDKAGQCSFSINGKPFNGADEHPLDPQKPIQFVIQDIHFKDEDIGPIDLLKLKASGTRTSQ